jgi:hypothetical protein
METGGSTLNITCNLLYCSYQAGYGDPSNTNVSTHIVVGLNVNDTEGGLPRGICMTQYPTSALRATYLTHLKLLDLVTPIKITPNAVIFPVAFV